LASSKPARPPLSCSNSVWSPAHRTTCRSAPDTRSSSCDDGTSRTRIVLPTPSLVPTTPRLMGMRWEVIPGRHRLLTGNPRTEQHLGMTAQLQMDSPLPNGENHRHRTTRVPLRMAVSEVVQYETLIETRVYERQTYPRYPHSPHHSYLGLVRVCLGGTSCVRQH